MYPPHLEFSFVLNTVLIKARQSVFPFKHEASQFCLDITGQEQQEKCRSKCRNKLQICRKQRRLPPA